MVALVGYCAPPFFFCEDGMINLLVAEGSRPTGRILTGLLQEMGVRIGREGARGVVSYGVRYEGALPCLNAMAGGRTKLTELRTLITKGVRTPNTFLYQGGNLTGIGHAERPTFPLFGRKLSHREGKDIMPCFQTEDVPMRVAAGAQFFTQYIPRDTEYRVYVYRKLHGATYKKVMRHPELYKYIGCSYRNGFAFELCREGEIPRDAVELAKASVSALGLDFGAVDILKGKDGHFYTLEVNTAPGVEGDGRQSIRFLAEKIATWERNGFLRRNGDEQNQIRR